MKNRRVKRGSGSQIGTKFNAALFAFVAFAAVVSILILGYLRFSDVGNAVIEVQPKNQHAAQKVAQDKIQAKLPETRAEMLHPSVDAIEGRWFSRIGKSGIAEITLGEGIFEIVYVEKPQDLLRKFSKGVYEYDAISGHLELYPKREAQPSLQMKGIRYKILTMRNYQMVVSQKKDDPALYFIAKERDIPGKLYHPLFVYDDFKGAPVLQFMPVAPVTEQ
tara:strand:- start:9296 stop:9955 length:660 start_codon:yes stop_codon:yes gene_type:complete